jgi:phosphatidylinositol glycan class B
MTGMMPGYWMRGVCAAQLASELRADPQMCGLALYDTDFYLLTGRDRLVGSRPLFALYSTDPLAAGHLAEVAATAAPAFNRILAARSKQKELPANFIPRDCQSVGGAEVCVFARDGGCNIDAASSFGINDVLTRVDF